MSWVYLIIAGIFEVGFACSLKMTEGFTKLWPSVFFFICIFASFHFLERSLSQIPISTAYAVWTGIGAAGTLIVGIILFKDPVTFWRLFFLSTLIGSVVGLKFVSGH